MASKRVLCGLPTEKKGNVLMSNYISFIYRNNKIEQIKFRRRIEIF